MEDSKEDIMKSYSLTDTEKYLRLDIEWLKDRITRLEQKIDEKDKIIMEKKRIIDDLNSSKFIQNNTNIQKTLITKKESPIRIRREKTKKFYKYLLENNGKAKRKDLIEYTGYSEGHFSTMTNDLKDEGIVDIYVDTVELTVNEETKKYIRNIVES